VRGKDLCHRRAAAGHPADDGFRYIGDLQADGTFGDQAFVPMHAHRRLDEPKARRRRSWLPVAKPSCLSRRRVSLSRRLSPGRADPRLFVLLLSVFGRLEQKPVGRGRTDDGAEISGLWAGAATSPRVHPRSCSRRPALPETFPRISLHDIVIRYLDQFQDAGDGITETGIRVFAGPGIGSRTGSSQQEH
jgi:hypothetical protein